MNLCAICDLPVAPGEGVDSIGIAPSLHRACLVRANAGLQEKELNEAAAALLAARRALGRAITGHEPTAIIAATCLMLTDLIAMLDAEQRNDELWQLVGNLEQLVATTRSLLPT